ncbi:MAG: hypothetical protein ACOZQL_09440 [Myxococcota bacterium]
MIVSACDWPEDLLREHRLHYGNLHARIDDRNLDPIEAAAIVIGVGFHRGAGRDDWGMAYTYLGLIDPQALDKRLAQLPVSPELRDAFRRRFAAASAGIRNMVAQFDVRRREMYLDAPAAVVARRKRYFQKHAALYQRFDEARAAFDAQPGPATASTAAPQLVALRQQYLRACGDATCRFDPFVVELTSELALMYSALSDAERLAAELQAMRADDAGRQLFGVELGTALYTAMLAEKERYERYEAARRAGASARTLEVEFGPTPPLHVDPVARTWQPFDALPPLVAAAPPQQRREQVVGVVRSVVKDRSGWSTITFRDDVQTVDLLRCTETNRIQSVTWTNDGSGRATGHVNYESDCRVVGKGTEVTKTAPVIVPPGDTIEVKPGELLTALVEENSRRGAVLEVTAPQSKADREARRPARVLQFRDARLAAR